MMNWLEDYQKKLVSPQEAVRHIHSNDRVVTGHAINEPTVLVNAMLAQKENYKNVEICNLVTLGESGYCKPEMKGHFELTSLFISRSNRDSINSGNSNFITSYFHEVPEIFRTTLRPNVAMIQVSPPDKHGYCSFGTSVDYTKPATEAADLVIAQVNPQMPRTLGDSFIHIRDINYIVEHETPLPESPIAKLGDVEMQIGENCAEIIQDGDTLQLGIGSIPDAVLQCLGHKQDLGIHSEMISDGVIELMDSGVINNRRKTLHPGKSVVTFLMGTKKLYDFVDDNPSIELYPVDYVNNPTIIMQNENMVSINSCIQVDLFGQVVSESIGLKQFSGVGGQVDFVRGANMSRGGRSIMAMPSTAAKGTVSRIVLFIDQGAAVTTSRNDVNYVVTEYGIAQLKGKNLKDRARALIAVAHPKFREELKEEFTRRFNECC